MLKIRSSLLLTLYYAFLAAIFLSTNVNAKNSSAQAQFTLKNKTWKTIKLKKIPKAAMINPRITSTGTVSVLLLNSQDAKNFPNIKEPLFRGQTDKQISFKVETPKADDYWLVINNNTEEAQKIFVKVDISPLKKPHASRHSFQESLKQFDKILTSYLTIKPITTQLAQCQHKPKANIICKESLVELKSYIPLGDTYTQITLLLLMQSAANGILQQWQYHPINTRSEDELSVVFLIMLGQQQSLKSALKQLAISMGKNKASKTSFLTLEQTNRLLRLLDDQTIVKSWQKTFIPHIQTKKLQKILNTSPSWADKKSIQMELIQRKQFKVK